MKAPSGLDNRVTWKHHLGSQNLGHNNLAIWKLNIPPICFDKFWIDGLRLVEEVSRSTKEKCLVDFETNPLKFLNIEKMLNINWGLIVSMYDGYHYDLNDLDTKWVRSSHCK